jgi:hypothetical protein
MRKNIILLFFLLSSSLACGFTVEPSLYSGAQFSSPIDDFGIMIGDGVNVYSLEGYRQYEASLGYKVSWSESRVSPLFGGGLFFVFSDDLVCSLKFSYVPGFSYKAGFYDASNYIMYSQKAGISLLTFSPGLYLQYTINDTFAFFIRAEFPGVAIRNINFSASETLYGGDTVYDVSNSSIDYEYYYSAGIGAKWRINSMFFLTGDAGYSSAAQGLSLIITAGFDLSNGGTAVSTDNSFAAFEGKGDNCFSSGDYKCAFEWYLDCISIRKTSAIYKKAGDCLFFSGNRQEALKYYDYSLKLGKNDALSDFIKKNY